mgnify:CR=1 FL=1
MKWNARYAEQSAGAAREISACLREWVEHAPPGRALDIACGTGRNAIFLASRGFVVEALDISALALAQARQAAGAAGAQVDWIERDLDEGLAVVGPYQLVIQLHYVNAAITRSVPSLLAPGGVFICQQHLQTSEAVGGPQSSQHRVAAGELPQLAAGLEILHYAETLRSDPDGQRFALATLVARRSPPGTSA